MADGVKCPICLGSCELLDMSQEEIAFFSKQHVKYRCNDEGCEMHEGALCHSSAFEA